MTERVTDTLMLLDGSYPAPGLHPMTHEPFVDATVSCRQERVRIHSLPPSPPTREIPTAFDDDDEPIDWRTLTDDEFATAQANYRKAHDEWSKTNGVRYIDQGHPIITGTFTTASGAWVFGILGPDNEWRWDAAYDPRLAP